jgi:Tfp pilus assembly protein FimT
MGQGDLDNMYFSTIELITVIAVIALIVGIILHL